MAEEPVAGQPPVPPAGEQPPAHFFDALPDDLKTYPGLAKFKADKPEESFASALRSYVNLEKMKGNMVTVPDEKTDPETAKAFWSKMGVPESPTDYAPPAVPEGFTIDKGLAEGFMKVAHEAKLPKAAAEKLMNWYIQGEVQKLQDFAQTQQQAMEKGMKELRSKWGAAADHNVALAQQVVGDFGVEGLKEALEETGAGNHPAIIAFLAKVGGYLAEDSVITAPQVGQSKSDVETALKKIMADIKHPFWQDKNAPGHAEAVQEVKRLNELIHGSL